MARNSSLFTATEADDGARAVEVVAMLGDSVVGVKHCIDPKAGKVQPATWALFAFGVASLIAFGVAFWIAVDTAAYNQGRYAYETQVLHKPGFAVRPRALPAGFDWIAFGGLLASIITCTAALTRMRKERQSPYVRIGTAPGVEFPVASAPAPDFAMVAPNGDDFVFRFGHGMEGEIVVGDTSTSFAELAALGRTTISPIPANAKIRVRTGMTSFLVSSIARPRRQAVPLFALDVAFAKSLAGTTVAFGLLLLLLFQIPVDSGGASFDLLALEDAAMRSSTTDRDTAPPPELDQPADERDEDSGGTGRSMALDAGRMGRTESDRATGHYKMQKTQEDPQLARQQAIEQARSAGILGTSALTTGGAFASLTGTSDVSSGFEDTDIYGGKLGNEAGEMYGGFGFAKSSFGPGGGGTGWGTICAGDFGTIGHGAGTGTGYGVGGGRCGTACRGRVAAIPTVAIGQPVSTGDLDKATIRRYIKRSIDKIRYCYEKQLLAKPGLAGTVATQFFITPSGGVTSATAAGVDPEVANCVADVIEGIAFPKPNGGGGVQVTYPFTFRPAGQ